MGNRNDYDYFDADNFDDGYDGRDHRRRQQNHRQSSYNRRSSYDRRRSANRRRKNRRRTRNRVIIVISGIAVVVLFIMILTFMFKGCTSSSPDPSSVSTDTITKQEASAVATEPQATTEPPKDDLSPTYFKTPSIKDDNTDGEFSNSIYVWNKAGYELFNSTTNASSYADAINSFAEKLSGITVYDMVIPNHTEFGLPQRLKEGAAASSSQADNIKDIYSKLSDKVTPINAYNYLADHNTDYIYFNSDSYWTGLGAYYAYKAFADTNKLTPLSLDKCTENKVDGFTGSYSSSSGNINSDTVQYWELPYSVSAEVTDGNGTVTTYDSPYYSGATAGSLTYGLFLMGDYNPLTVLKSSSDSAQKGKKIAVVKETYGNPFAPYLTDNYEEVHVIDFRTFRNVQTDLASYCNQNSIDEVLFINSIMSTNNQLDSMNSLFN